MWKFRKKAATFIILCLAIAALVVGMAIPVLAAPNGSRPVPVILKTVQGSVLSLLDTSFVIENDNQVEATINVNDNTTYFLIYKSKPGFNTNVNGPAKRAQFSDIEVGDKIVARVTADGNNLAKEITMTKPPIIQIVTGIISAVSYSSITISQENGTDVFMTVDQNTRVILKGLVLVQEGETAVASYNRLTLVAQVINIEGVLNPAAPATLSFEP
jgi:hypothetical protein